MKIVMNKEIKLGLIIVALLFKMGVKAQQWEVTNLKKLNVKGFHLKFDVYDEGVFFSGSNFSGLKRLDLGSGEILTISEEPGAGYQPKIGVSEVSYRVRGEGARFIYQFEERREVKNQRIDEGISVRVSGNLTEIIIENRSDATFRELAPKGRGDYLNVSLSPDYSKILFRVSGLGSFISDLEGNILHELGNAEFPAWLSDQSIVYTITKDDGYQYLSSDLYVKDLTNGAVQELSNEVKGIALYPSTDIINKRVGFHTPEGEMYVIDLKRK